MEQAQLKWHTCSMKTTEIIVIIHFLEILRKQTQNERLRTISSPAFHHLLSKKELKRIVNYMHEMEGSEAPKNIHKMDKKELVEIIGDEYFILSYFIEEVLGKYNV